MLGFDQTYGGSIILVVRVRQVNVCAVLTIPSINTSTRTTAVRHTPGISDTIYNIMRIA